ncbi:MAG: sigma 54-interacting transcriptional regulator [Deltaproteobacteria bacterium]|nr:sigma 54-interacting transcriptional regulator [Deltaproteobacteria bacterium]
MDLIKKYLMKDIDVLLDCIDEAILIVDYQGNILKHNEAFSRLTDLSGRSLVGENMKDIVAGGTLKESAALKSLEVKKKIDMNVTYETGQTATWTYIPVFDEQGNLVLTIGTGRDITKLLTLEKKLKISEIIISQFEDKKYLLEGNFGHGEIVFSSPKMQQVMRMCWKVAASSSPVLVWGETGVGKELVAGFIHQSSDRSNKPFVAINCATIPDELLEAELFGYEEGSFTGAKRSGKKGILEDAHEGTLFLDEIGELPLKMQSKLLRFLQEGNFQRIGSNKLQQVDVRILSATNLTEDQLMNSKHFRQDLFYRIGVVPIYVPSLRERKEDIFPLIRNFIQQFNTTYQANIKIPPKLMKRLYDYDWPGNVRELRNVIERIAILYGSKELSEDDIELVLHCKQQDSENFPAASAATPPSALPSSLKSATEQFEENLIRQAYQTTGSIIKASKMLGINPSTIHRKLKKGILRIR